MLPSNQELSNLLGILYDAAGDPSLWGVFIERLARRSEASSGGLLFHDLKHAQGSVSSEWHFDPNLVRVYQQHYHRLDIWAQRGRIYPAGYVCTSQSLCPLPEMGTKEIYNDFMVKAGIEHGMFAILENNESCLASVSLFRDRSRSEFTEADLQTLQFLAPHLRRAFMIHLQLSESSAHSAGAEAALDVLPVGIILMGSKGEIIFMNKSATSTVAEKDGLLATENRLRAELSAESALLSSTVDNAAAVSVCKGACAGGTVLISRRTRRPLQVLVSPIRPSAVQLSQKIAVAVFIYDPSRPQRPADTLLRTLYGLTRAECRVALLLSDGYAPREIAEKVGVTDNTVRSQIKSIFSKTGAKRQGELIRLLISSPGPTIQGMPTP